MPKAKYFFENFNEITPNTDKKLYETPGSLYNKRMKNWSPYKFIIFGALILLAVGGNIPGTYDPLHPRPAKTDQTNLSGDGMASAPRLHKAAPRLSAETEQHILYGNENGGGHHYTADRPCKTEFPESWSATKIIDTVKQLAANDNAAWRQEENGYYVSEQPYEGLEIRIVLDEQGDDIVTAYPTNLPRNPCN